MGATLTVYCLEKLTDYFEFERLSHDLMAKLGYSAIEPLGGFQDKGRDAIHVSQSGETTIFAYSVREDWRAKLAEDARKIRQHNHICDKLVFVTTADVSASERDEAVNTINQEYGWKLDLFPVERLRSLLDVQFPELKRLHPHIFPPSILAFEATPTPEAYQHVFISYSLPDKPLVDWLARKLSSEGYSVWCEHIEHLGAAPFPTDIEQAIRTQVVAVIAVFSSASFNDPEAVRHRVIAQDEEKHRETAVLIPINAGVSPDQLDRQSAGLRFISFQQSWLTGLLAVIKCLEQMNCPRLLVNGKELAARTFVLKNALAVKAEVVLSNCLRIQRLPENIKLFTASQAVSPEKLKLLRSLWSFRRVDATKFLSFQAPPVVVSDGLTFEEGNAFPWSQLDKIHGIEVTSLVSELLRKAMVVKCHGKGLQYCEVSKLIYFPENLLEGNWLTYTKPDGSPGRFLAVGQRTLWRPNGSQKYKYYLAPEFTVRQDLFDPFTVLAHLRIRFTNTDGKPLIKRNALSRRKHLCRDWWNEEWLHRLLAVCQYLADENGITIGTSSDEQIVITPNLMSFTSPVGINETYVDPVAYDRSGFVTDEDMEYGVDEDEASND